MTDLKEIHEAANEAKRAEQEEMGNLLHTLEHLQNTARKAIHGENDGN